jgi:hypothetical protein
LWRNYFSKKIRATPTVDTAAVMARSCDVRWNPSWFNSLGTRQQREIAEHELDHMLHCIRHLQQKRRWNAVTDAEINRLISTRR